jgi:hypothetical protein
MSHEQLPWGWQHVTGEARESQLDLFRRRRDELLAVARVSLDELSRWRAKGWISFDCSSLDELPEPLFNEVIFIRNLARSGLSDEQINQLLTELEAPYRYHPTRTAYSFAFGWVQPPPILDDREVDEFVRFHLERWIDHKVLVGDVAPVKVLQNKIFAAIARAQTAKTNESDGE